MNSVVSMFGNSKFKYNETKWPQSHAHQICWTRKPITYYAPQHRGTWDGFNSDDNSI
jgi:hypothetical protein